MLNRRDILRGSAAIGLLSSVPTIGHAAVDPKTALTAAKAVVEIGQKIAKATSDREVKLYLASIKGQLDTLIRQNALILESIERMRLFISRRLFDAVRFSKQTTIIGKYQTFTMLTAAARPDRAAARREALAIGEVTRELAEYDIGAFYHYALGISMSLALHKLAGSPSSDITISKQSFAGGISRWLEMRSPIEEMSTMADALADNQKAIAVTRAELAAYPRKVKVREYPTGDAFIYCLTTDYWSLSGDERTPFQATPMSEEWCESRTGDFGVKTFDAAMEADPASAYPNLPTKTPEGASTNPYVNQANAIRNRLIDHLRREQDLLALQSEMRQLRDALRS
jgi:hypothetical protein